MIILKLLNICQASRHFSKYFQTSELPEGPKLFFRSCRSSKMSNKLLDIFLKILKDFLRVNGDIGEPGAAGPILS